MSSRHDKVIAIRGSWAALLVSVMGSLVVGGITYALNAHAQMAVMQENIAELKAPNLPDRMARIEENVNNTKQTVNEMSRKLDQMMVEIRRNK